MATRWYFGNTAAPYTPATVKGGFEKTAGAVTGLLAGRPAGTATTIAQAVGATTNPTDVLWGRWVSAPAVAGGTISGNVAWIIGRVENNAALNANAYAHIWVTVGDSDTVRGTLLANYAGATEFTTTATGNGTSGLPVTSVAIQAGDRVVIEMGYRALGSGSTAYTATMNYGGTGLTDLVAGGTGGTNGPTVRPGWLEFTNGSADGLFAPLVSGLVDTFNDNTLDPLLWDYSYGTHSETGGRARVGCESVQYSGYGSLPIWQLTESAVYVQVPTLPAASGGAEVYSNVTVLSGVAGSYAGVYFNRVTGKIRFNNNVDYFDGSAVEITYSATDHQWVRIRHAGTSLYWDTSPDGTTWTTRRTLATAPAWTRYQGLQVALECHRDTGTVDYGEFDNVNTLPPSEILMDLGAAPEASSARPITAVKSYPIGAAHAADSALGLSCGKTAVLGSAGTTDTARAVTASKRLMLGAARERIGVHPLTPSITIPLGAARERTAAWALAHARTAQLGTAREQAAATPLTHARSTQLGLAREQTSAGTVGYERSTSLAAAAETSRALPLTAAKTMAIGAASAADRAFPLTASKRIVLGTARAVDRAGHLGTEGASELGTARSLDGARAVATAKTTAIGTAVARDAARPLAVAKATAVGIARAADTARPLTAAKTAALAGARERTRAGAVTPAKRLVLGTARESTVARPLSAAGGREIVTARSRDTARPFTPSKRFALGAARAKDRAHPLVTQAARALTTARTRDLAHPLTPGKHLILGTARTVDHAGGLSSSARTRLGTAREHVRAGALRQPFQLRRLGTARERTTTRGLTVVRQRPADHLVPSVSGPRLTPGTRGPTLAASTAGPGLFATSTTGG